MTCLICGGPVKPISNQELQALPGCNNNEKHYEYYNVYRCISHNVLTNYGSFFNPNYFIFINDEFYLLVWKAKYLYIHKFKKSKNDFEHISTIDTPMQHLNANRIQTILNYQ